MMAEIINKKIINSDFNSKAKSCKSEEFSESASEDLDDRNAPEFDGLKTGNEDVAEEFWAYIKGYN